MRRIDEEQVAGCEGVEQRQWDVLHALFEEFDSPTVFRSQQTTESAHVRVYECELHSRLRERLVDIRWASSFSCVGRTA